MKKLNKTYAGQKTKKRKRITKWQTKVIILCVISTITAWNFVTLANMYLEAYTPKPVQAETKKIVEPSIKEYIFNEVEQALGFDEAVKAMNIINCESRFNPNAIGMNKTSVDNGIWQWNNKWHPEVTPQCAFDYKCATEHAIRVRLEDKNWHQWTCGR